MSNFWYIYDFSIGNSIGKLDASFNAVQTRAAKTSMVAPSIVLIVCGLNLDSIAIVSLIYKH